MKTIGRSGGAIDEESDHQAGVLVARAALKALEKDRMEIRVGPALGSRTS